LIHVPAARRVLRLLQNQQRLSNAGALSKHVNPATGRMHSSYSIAAQRPGRMTCSDPNFGGMPGKKEPGFRRVIVAEPGNALVGADYSQVELRAAAHLSGCPALTEVYATGQDVHRRMAARAHGIPLEKVSDAQRDAVKTIVFGSLYGGGGRTLAANAFAQGVDINADMADEWLAAFFAEFPGVAKWVGAQEGISTSRGYIAIGCGRVVEPSWVPGGHLSRQQCINYPVQGVCADLIMRAITLIHARLSGLHGGLIASVHDELIAEMRADDAEMAKEIIERSMIEAFESTFPGAPTLKLVEAKIGATWADL
jgi:DNA polymerase-1